MNQPRQSITDPPRSTLATVARCIARSLEAEYGIDPLPVLADVGIDPSVLESGELRLPMTGLSELWRRCVELTGDEHFGVRIARYVAPADLYGIDLALYTSATLGEAVQRFTHFLELLTTVSQGRIERQGDGDWQLSYHVMGQRQPTDTARDFFIYSQILMFERQSHLPARDFLRRLELRRPQPAEPRHWQIAGVETSFNHPFASYIFKADVWDRPMLGANPHLLAQVEQPILEYLAQQGAPLPLSALRARLVERLCEPLTQETFAESLGVAASNLQESLEHQHVNFAQLLDQAREAQTLNLLAMPNLTLEQVSARVGFSNTSSLIRAFRRWQGMTPLKYRKQRLAPGP